MVEVWTPPSAKPPSYLIEMTIKGSDNMSLPLFLSVWAGLAYGLGLGRDRL